MTKEKETSVIKEAVVEYKELMEAASANAEKKLADKFPDEFNKLLKEEIENKNKTKKESYKKIDEGKESDKDDIESNKESVMKKEKETKKVVKEEEGKHAKEGKPFEEKAPENGPDVVKEEREKDFMGDVETDTPNKADGKTEDGDAFVEEPTTKKESVANDTQLKEEFDITELDASSVGTALENAEDDDEVITMDEIESEIANMEGLDEDLSAGVDAEKPKAGKDDGVAYDKLVTMKNQIDEMLAEMKNHGGQGANSDRREHGGPDQTLIDEEENMDEQKNHGGKGANKVNAGGPTTAMIEEETDEITTADVEAVLGEEEIVDENMEHTQTHDVARKAGAKNHTNYGKAKRLRAAEREAQNEGEDKKIGSLIEENKKLTKQLNETKKYKQSVTTLVEQYKGALEKYRNQLKEMATFNTNLAHVNNLLVNEGLSLTQEDKIKIIEEFKKVNTITESQEKYKSMLTEMKESKKALTESMEKKVSASVAPSSKKLDEAKEVTAYADNEHVQKMKRLIETIEGRGSKKIIK